MGESFEGRILSSEEKLIDPDIGVQFAFPAWDYKMYDNTAHDDQLAVGPCVFSMFAVSSPGSTGATVTIKDTSDGSDGNTVLSITNPDSSKFWSIGTGVKLTRGLRVTTTNGGSGVCPTFVLLYKKF